MERYGGKGSGENDWEKAAFVDPPVTEEKALVRTKYQDLEYPEQRKPHTKLEITGE